MPQLNTYVHVHDSHGDSHEFGPGEDVPGWAVELITNPDVWQIAPDTAEPEPVPPAAPVKRTARKAPPKASA